MFFLATITRATFLLKLFKVIINFYPNLIEVKIYCFTLRARAIRFIIWLSCSMCWGLFRVRGYCFILCVGIAAFFRFNKYAKIRSMHAREPINNEYELKVF